MGRRAVAFCMLFAGVIPSFVFTNYRLDTHLDADADQETAQKCEYEFHHHFLPTPRYALIC